MDVWSPPCASAFISELASDSVAGAVEDGAMRSADDVSVSAIAAVAGVSAGAARHLQTVGIIWFFFFDTP